jgi:hypothetical protein
MKHHETIELLENVKNVKPEEGDEAAIEQSFEDAKTFLEVGRFEWNPDVMRHSNGRAGLLWSECGLYADLEFLGGGLLAYFARQDENIWKGVIQMGETDLPLGLKKHLKMS